MSLALERWPSEQIGRERQADRALLRGDFWRALGWVANLVARRQRHDLRLARALEVIEPDEALAIVYSFGVLLVPSDPSCKHAAFQARIWSGILKRIRTVRTQEVAMPNSSIKNEKLYEDLRKEGNSNEPRASPTRLRRRGIPQWARRAESPVATTTGRCRN